MNQNGRDWIEETHRAAAEQYLEEEERGRALIEQIHREALERRRQEEDRVLQMILEAHRRAATQSLEQVQPPAEPPTVHYTELQDLPADSPIREEWNTFRRELPCLLKDGLEGKFALVKGGEIAGIFASFDEGVQAGHEKYLLQPFMVQPIREREPLLRIRGHSLPCHSSIIRSPRAN